jgi:molybdenum cofactor cytidylyltransferase
MSYPPTLIILATPSPTALPGQDDQGARPAVPDFQHIAQTLDLAMDAELPVVLVASRWVKQQCEVFAPEISCVESELLSPPGQPGQDWVKAVGQAVQACPQANGWLVMPTPMNQIQVATLRQLASAVHNSPLVRPSHQMQAGYPLGFSPEFYSELVRLNSDSELRRLLSRYPMVHIDVDDPGVTIGQDASLLSWRPTPALLQAKDPRSD